MEVAVVGGCGVLGQRVSGELLLLGNKVWLVDRDEKRFRGVVELIRADLNGLAAKGVCKPEDVDHIVAQVQCSTDVQAALANCQLVIECVPEDLKLKRSVIESISNACPNTCLIATSSLSLNISDIASAAKYPTRFLGIRFLWPVYLIDEVEISVSSFTAMLQVQRAKNILKSWKKKPFFKLQTNVLGKRLTQADAHAKQTELLLEQYLIDETRTELGGARLPERECAVCMDTERCVLFEPCGHLTTCEKCSDQLLTTTRLCPICRQRIDKSHRAHLC